MQAAVERREGREQRVPVDVMIELSHPGFDEAFEADGVNVSAGGLAMRAAYLPEIGAKLRCKFDCPPDGESLEAEAEVVWSDDSGEHMGHFGVRFLEPSPRVQEAIRRLSGGDATNPELSLPSEPAVVTAKLELDGVSSPIFAKVAHRADDLVTMEQELPFLQLGKGARISGESMGDRRGRLESVELRIEGDTPRLVLAVVYDDDAGVSEKAPAARDLDEASARDALLREAGIEPSDATLPDFTDVRGAAARASLADAARDEVGQGDREAASRMAMPPSVVVVGGPDMAIRETRPTPEHVLSQRVQVANEVRAEGAVRDGWHVAHGGAHAPSTTAASVVAKQDHHPAGAKHDKRADHARVIVRADKEALADGPGDSGPELRSQLAQLLARLEPLAERAKDAAKQTAEKTGPWLTQAMAKVRVWLAAAWAFLAPWVAKVMARSKAVAGAATERVRERIGERFPGVASAKVKRRTTAPAPTPVAATRKLRRAQVEEDAELEAAPTSKRKIVIGSIVAAGAVAGAVYALTPSDPSHVDAGAATAVPATVAQPSDTSSASEAAAPAHVAVQARPTAEAPVARPLAAQPGVQAGAVQPAANVAVPPRAGVDPESGIVEPIAVPPPPPVQVRMPTALPAPSYESGPMPAPTYPSMHNTGRAPAGQVAPTSPYAVDVRPEAIAGRAPGSLPAAVAAGQLGMPTAAQSPTASAPVVAATQPTLSGPGSAYGAATVPSARSFTLRMSGPVTQVRGTTNPDGFTVVLPGVLALDRAGPIAANMPEMLSRSYVLNRGDRAELTVVFAQGRAPAFRVVARGAAIEVLVARR